MIQCPLCGYVIRPEQKTTACARCPLSSGCDLTCCANCGYQWPEASLLVTWWRRWQQRRQTRAQARRESLWGLSPMSEVPLECLPIGETATVESVRTSRHRYWRQLSTLGVAPGAAVSVRQRQPALVIRIGETDLALDAEAGREIFVQRA